MICPHCQKEFNAGKVMGEARTQAKRAAAKKRGAEMKRLFANARKMEGAAENLAGSSNPRTVGFEPKTRPTDENENPSPAVPFIAPKGSFSKEDLKALIQVVPKATDRWKRDVEAEHNGSTSFLDTPCAPFDLSIEGEPHRVRQLGKGLWLVFLGPDGEKPIRQLKDGELEQLWERRNK